MSIFSSVPGACRVSARSSPLLLFAAIVFIASNTAAEVNQGAQLQAVRWYGQEPHVPLVSIDARKSINHIDERDCRRWARVGSRWVGVGEWGQLLGPRVLRRRELNTDSHCFEVEFGKPKQRTVFAKDAAVVYASAGWTSAPSVKWEPSPSVRAEHEEFLTAFTKLMIDQKWYSQDSRNEPIPSIRERTKYFRFNLEDSSHEFAVSGGKILVLAERLRDGKWIAKYYDNTLSQKSPGSILTYEPIAVFDMNHNGVPEVIFHQVEERWFWYGEVVLLYSSEDQKWHETLGMYGTE